MIVGMVLEMLGVGLVVPALSLMTSEGASARFPAVGRVLEALGNPSQETIVIGGILLLVSVTTVKAVFLGFLTLWQGNFVYGLQADLSQRLFNGYLRLPYTFHLQRNSAELIRNSMSQVGDVTVVTQQGLIVLTEMLVLVGIFIMLVIVEPIGALIVVAILGAASALFARVTRRRVTRWGEERQVHEGLRIQHLQQGLGGVKDVKLLGREGEFLERYRVHNFGSARIAKLITVVGSLPRLWLELLAVLGLATLVIVMLERGRPMEALIPTLGMFAAAAFRVMPSANRMLSGAQSVLFCLPMVGTVHRELQLIGEIPPTKPAEPFRFTQAIELRHVAFRYPAVDAQALRDVSMTIPRGAAVGIIGGSGAGKSTLVDTILGLLTPASGSIAVDGVDIQTNLRGWQNDIGYVPQAIYLTDDTLRRNVAFGLPDLEIDDAKVWRAVRLAQIESFVHEQPQGLDTPVGERGVRLSGGQRQRIGIARALYHDPPLLVLDEATSALDTVTERGVMESVRALHGSKTLIIVAHRFSTVEYCDRIFRLDGGRVVEEGDSATVLKNARSA